MPTTISGLRPDPYVIAGYVDVTHTLAGYQIFNGSNVNIVNSRYGVPSDLVSRHTPGTTPWAFDPNVAWVTAYSADQRA